MNLVPSSYVCSFRCHNALDLEEWSKRLEKRDEEPLGLSLFSGNSGGNSGAKAEAKAYRTPLGLGKQGGGVFHCVSKCVQLPTAVEEPYRLSHRYSDMVLFTVTGRGNEVTHMPHAFLVGFLCCGY